MQRLQGGFILRTYFEYPWHELDETQVSLGKRMPAIGLAGAQVFLSTARRESESGKYKPEGTAKTLSL
jgi:hypothetical protein